MVREEWKEKKTTVYQNALKSPQILGLKALFLFSI